MTIDEGFLLLIRWLHALAAMAWIGGSLFYVLVLRPQLPSVRGQGTVLGPETLKQFRSLVNTSMAILLVTGAVLLFDRLTDASTTSGYVITLSIKIGIALWMFAIAHRRWRQRQAQIQSTSPSAAHRRLVARVMGFMSGVNMTIILGVVVFFLSDLLTFIFEKGLTIR